MTDKTRILQIPVGRVHFFFSLDAIFIWAPSFRCDPASCCYKMPLSPWIAKKSTHEGVREKVEDEDYRSRSVSVEGVTLAEASRTAIGALQHDYRPSTEIMV